MAKRDSNIVLNTIDDGEPAVQRRADAEESTDNEPSHDEPTDGVTNPDGSVTEYVTPKEPPGKATAENVPENPLNPEIQQFKNEVEHPEDWTDSELKAIAQQRRTPELSPDEISDRVNLSTAVVKRGQRKVRHAELSATNDIRAAFQKRTPIQQLTIAAHLTGAPEYSTGELAELADCKPGSIRTARRRFQPLIRRLDEASLPERLVPQPIRDDLGESDEEQSTDEMNTDNASESSKTEKTGDATDTPCETESEQETTDSAPHTETTPEPTSATVTIEDVREFVTVLQEAATKEHSLSESPTAQQGTAARLATCEAILNYIDQQMPREQ
jgi:hypothetical protein